jgi:predicted DsbA family dithiol-disulfide isomerase
MDIEIWSDIVCPWCYLGKRRFELALQSFEHRDSVNVVYRSFELDPNAPSTHSTPTVELLASKYGLSPEQAIAGQRQMEERAAADGLTFQMDGLQSGNTRDAHRLVQLARAHGQQAEMNERLHRAYFSEHKSIFDHASLTELAVEVGLDRAEVSTVLAGDDYGREVDADEAKAQVYGITGVPFFVIDSQYGISGAQSPEIIGETLQKVWAGVS